MMTKAEQCKIEVSRELMSALNGTAPHYLYKDEKGRGYIRWGLVERNIHNIIDKLFAEEPIEKEEQ